MKPILILASAMAIAAAPMVALAKPNLNNGNGNGNGNGHQEQSYDGENRDCSPGLADRNPPCVPPGLARQGVTTEEWLNRDFDYQVGDVLQPTDFDYLNDPEFYGLPLLTDGSRYAIIDGTVVALDSESYEILQLIRAFAAVAN